MTLTLTFTTERIWWWTSAVSAIHNIIPVLTQPCKKVSGGVVT